MAVAALIMSAVSLGVNVLLIARLRALDRREDRHYYGGPPVYG